MSLFSPRYEAGLVSNGRLALDIMTALLITFAAVLVLVRLAAALGVAPATDLEFLALAYG
jgi:hypothetical protein